MRTDFFTGSEGNRRGVKLTSTVRVLDTATGEDLAILRGQRGSVFALAFSGTGVLATGSSEKVVRLWDIVAGREIATLHGHSGSVMSVSFSPDGRRLVSCTLQALAGMGSVRLWDVTRGQEVLTLPGAGAVVRVVFSPDGRRIAAAGRGDRGVIVWDGPPLPGLR